ncbi:histidine phosphatase family protein [Polaromonas sp. YR568]|uniref:histidine phosphatase family protein n=1 Tax=Polaromonas sp. YR568 TaxID=1855301 RepID=UPI0031379915
MPSFLSPRLTPLHPRPLRRSLLLWLSLGLMAAAAHAQPAAIPSTESSAPEPSARMAPQQLAAALQGGGYVIYFRHTATDFSRNDANMKGYADCANQRPLNEQGRADARAIGQHVKRLGLPVTEVFASPFCRTLETARQMLSRATPRTELREREGDDYPGLKTLLATPVPAGANRWMVGHGIPFRAVAGAPHLAEGEAVVIRPGTTRWTVVARILPSEWAALR